MNLGIRWKVALGTLAAVLVGLVVAGWLVIRSVEQTELGRMAEMLETRSGLAAMTLRPLFDQSGPTVPSPQLHATIRELSQQAHLRISIIRQDGAVLSDSAVPAEGLAHVDNHLSRPEVAQALASGRGMDIRASQTTGERTYYVARLLTDLTQRQPAPRGSRLAFP